MKYNQTYVIYIITDFRKLFNKNIILYKIYTTQFFSFAGYNIIKTDKLNYLNALIGQYLIDERHHFNIIINLFLKK